MSKALPAGRSWPSLPDLDLIASQSRLTIRHSRKFSAAGFLQSLLSAVVTGLASLNQIAGDLKDRNHPGMARQSLHQRFDTRSTAFLMTVLCDLMQQRYSTAATAIESSAIQRILIEDASSQVMPKSNADAFPAHGNHHGKTAGVKIDLAFDLLTGFIVSHSLQAATEQDKSIGKEFVIEVRRGDLVLRDMGYFSLGELTAIEQREAWWLTRLPLTTGVMLADGRSLEKYLEVSGETSSTSMPSSEHKAKSAASSPCARPRKFQRPGALNVAKKPGSAARIHVRKVSFATAGTSC